MMSFALRLAALLLFTVACGRSFEALTPEAGPGSDGGVDDGGPDGGTCVFPTGCAGPVASAPPGLEPATTCTDGCRFYDCRRDVWVDGDEECEHEICWDGGWLAPLEPVLFDASATVPTVVDHDGVTFFLSFLNGNPSPCDGSCPVVMEAMIGDDPRTAAIETSPVMPAYWSDAPTTTRLDVRKAGTTSRVLLTSVSESLVAWQWRPLRREGWQNDGTFDFSDPVFAERRVADVAPLGDHAVPTRSSRIAIVHLPETPEAEGYFDDLQVVAIDEGGSSVTYRDLFPLDGVRTPRVIDGTSWVAAIQNWHPSASGGLVHLVQVDDPTSHRHGGSYGCGVEGFDAVRTWEGEVAVVQDCADRSEIGGAVELELHGEANDVVVVSQRRSFVPSRITAINGPGGGTDGFVVALVEQGASSPTLAFVRGNGASLEVQTSMRMPVAEGLRLPITSVDLVARDDRAVLVTWTGTPADPEDLWAWDGPEAAFTIVQRCPCVDTLCI